MQSNLIAKICEIFFRRISKMLETRQLRLRPEQKTLLLPQGEYKRDSIDNLNKTLVVASDVTENVYTQLYGVIEHLTALDQECSQYHGDQDLNNEIIMAASMVNHIQRRIDQKLMDANPHIEDVQI